MDGADLCSLNYSLFFLTALLSIAHKEYQAGNYAKAEQHCLALLQQNLHNIGVLLNVVTYRGFFWLDRFGQMRCHSKELAELLTGGGGLGYLRTKLVVIH